ncbi:MAG: lipocalin family protein [Rikenellaceae bacterium]
MFKSLTFIVLAVLVVGVVVADKACCSSRKTKINRTTVAKLDINRYLGLWYEIARFDNRFERDLTHVTAFYSLNSKGGIKVENKGYNTVLKEWTTAVGRAKRTKQVGRLRVSFFWIFFSDYNILALGDTGVEGQPYEWALVGSKSSAYLWILARKSKLDNDTLKHIEDIAISRGYDVQNFL